MFETLFYYFVLNTVVKSLPYKLLNNIFFAAAERLGDITKMNTLTFLCGMTDVTLVLSTFIKITIVPGIHGARQTNFEIGV